MTLIKKPCKWIIPIGSGPSAEHRAGIGKVLHVGMQHGHPCIWTEELFDGDELAETYRRSVALVGTGWDVPRSAVHLGSTTDGTFVWHLYETGRVL